MYIYKYVLLVVDALSRHRLEKKDTNQACINNKHLFRYNASKFTIPQCFNFRKTKLWLKSCRPKAFRIAMLF